MKDALALLGSPGSPATSVHQLDVKNGNVWVGEAAWDPVPNSAFFGSDPGSPSYGARLMSVDGGVSELGQYQIITPEEASAYVARGIPLALQPLVGGIPTEVAWRYLETAVAATIAP